MPVIFGLLELLAVAASVDCHLRDCIRCCWLVKVAGAEDLRLEDAEDRQAQAQYLMALRGMADMVGEGRFGGSGWSCSQRGYVVNDRRPVNGLVL